jgi:ACS family glucarate transporter-like MFS transporter
VSATAAAKFSRTQALVVGLMFGFSVMSYFNRTIMSIAGPRIMKEFGLSEVQLGAIYSAFLFAYALLMIPGGKVADHLGPRRVLGWTTIGSAVFTALTALGGDPGLGVLVGVVPSFILIRLGLGIVTAPLYPATGSMNANWMSAGQRGRAQGIVNSGAGLGGALSPLLFASMIAWTGWRLSFCIAGALTAALGGAWFLLVPPPAAASAAARAPTPWRALLANRNLMFLTAGYFMLDYFEYIFFYWIYYYLGEIRHIGSELSGLYTTVLFLGFLLMMPVGGWTCDRLVARWGPKRGLSLVGTAGTLLGALLLFAGVNAGGVLTAVVLMSLALGFAACADVAYWAAAIEVAGPQVGAACGILNTGGNVGGFIAPALTPLVAAYFGWSGGLYFGAAMALAGALTWFAFDPRPYGTRHKATN